MKKLILLSILLIVGCAHKPPLATFYIGMTKEEFNEQNKDKIANDKDGFITKNIGFLNTQGYYDGDDPWSRNAYMYGFIKDTLQLVHRGMLNLYLGREIDYEKYATPPEILESEAPDVKTPEIEMNILDGNISSGSTTLKTEDIIKDCKKECVTFTISSDEWCDCMNQCSQKVIDKVSFGDMNVKVYIEECP
jgi:hypothetical protein